MHVQTYHNQNKNKIIYVKEYTSVNGVQNTITSQFLMSNVNLIIKSLRLKINGC